MAANPDRVTFYLVVPAVVGAASIVNALAFGLSRMLSGEGAFFVDLATAAAIAVVLLSFAFAIRGMRRGRWVRLIFALLVILAAGFSPRVVDAYVADLKAQAEQAAGADMETAFGVDLLARSDDLTKRIADKRPYTGDEALALVGFAADADLTAYGLFDHTPDTFDLVTRAIEAGILDPNVPVGPPDSVTPLAVAFFDKRIQPAAPGQIDRHDWEMLQLLVSKGADTSVPAAAGLRAALARTAVPVGERFIALQ